MTEPTPFLEANALLHIQENEYQEAMRCLEKMLPGELQKLERATFHLAAACDTALRRKLGANT